MPNQPQIGNTQLNIQIGVEFKFLNRDLKILFEKKSEDIDQKEQIDNLKLSDYTYDRTHKIKKMTFLLAPNKLETGTGITFTEIINDFNRFFGEKSATEAGNQMNSQVESENTSGKKISDNIIFKLKTAYLYTSYYEVVDTNNETIGVWNDDEGAKTKCEDKKPIWDYAVSLEIDSAKLFGDIKLFTIERTSISLWNTTRDSVLNMMSLGSAEDILKRLDKK